MPLKNENTANEPTAAYGLADGKVITDISLLDTNKLYTYAQYLTWQFKERIELIKGRLFKMSPAPTVRHQRISREVSKHFINYFDKKPCEVFIAPFDVRFPKNDNDKNPHTVVQPDICVICDVNKMDEKGCNGAPDLIVEILSPSTSAKDTRDKFLLYEEFGVKEYWVADPTNKIIDVFLLKDRKYHLIRKYNEFDTIAVEIFPELQINLKEVFED